MNQQKYNMYCKNAINFINERLDTHSSINAYIKMFNEQDENYDKKMLNSYL